MELKKEHFRLFLNFLSDLLGESAGLDGRKLLVIEVCKHAAQYGVMLKQKTQKPVSKDSQCGLLFMYLILVTETHSP